MFIVNFGLQSVGQSVGLERKEMDEKHKRLVAKTGSMKEICKLSLKHPDMK